jgi:hypothetical protein
MLDILIPPLIVILFFGLVFAIGIGITYLMLLVYDGEIRKCPECGRRRAARLTETDTLNERSYIDQSMMARMAMSNKSWVKPHRITETTYEDHFVCKFCGHAWSKTVLERKRNPS